MVTMINVYIRSVMIPPVILYHMIQTTQADFIITRIVIMFSPGTIVSAERRDSFPWLLRTQTLPEWTENVQMYNGRKWGRCSFECANRAQISRYVSAPAIGVQACSILAVGVYPTLFYHIAFTRLQLDSSCLMFIPYYRI